MLEPTPAHQALRHTPQRHAARRMISSNAQGEPRCAALEIPKIHRGSTSMHGELNLASRNGLWRRRSLLRRVGTTVVGAGGLAALAAACGPAGSPSSATQAPAGNPPTSAA